MSGFHFSLVRVSSLQFSSDLRVNSQDSLQEAVGAEHLNVFLSHRYHLHVCWRVIVKSERTLEEHKALHDEGGRGLWSEKGVRTKETTAQMLG